MVQAAILTTCPPAGAADVLASTMGVGVGAAAAGAVGWAAAGAAAAAVGLAAPAGAPVGAGAAGGCDGVVEQAAATLTTAPSPSSLSTSRLVARVFSRSSCIEAPPVCLGLMFRHPRREFKPGTFNSQCRLECI